MFKRFSLLLLLIGLGTTPVALSAAKSKAKSAATSKTVVRVGDKWGGDKEAQLSISWNSYGKNERLNEGLLRQPFIDLTRSKIPRSIVPMTRKKISEAVYFTVKMSATQTGKVSTCSLEKAEYDSAAVAPTSSYFCSFMVKQGYIHPPLDKTGKRLAITGYFETNYRARTQNFMVVQTGPTARNW